MSADATESVDWRDLQEFAGVRLDRSYVLSWQLEAETLFVDVDLYLTSEHPHYEKPRPAEKVCIRPAIVEFPWCERIVAEDGSEHSTPGMVASLGDGSLESIRRLADGSYEICGEFGKLTVVAERPVVRVKTAG